MYTLHLHIVLHLLQGSAQCVTNYDCVLELKIQDINQMIFSWPLLHWSPRYGPSGTFASRNAAIYSYGKVEGGQFGVVVVE